MLRERDLRLKSRPGGSQDCDVLVIGGGFAGMYAALAARRKGGSRVDVALVSASHFLVVRPRLYEAATESHAVDLRPMLAAVDIRFIAARVDRLEGTEAVLGDGRSIRAGRVVLACGSVMRRPAVPGAEFTYSIDDLSAAAKLETRLRRLALSERPRIAVVGAGFTGLELVLELRDRLSLYGAPAGGANAAITLIEKGGEVGAGFGRDVQAHVRGALEEGGVDTLLSAGITCFGPDAIEIASRPAVPSDCTILCLGLVAAPLVATLCGPRDGQGRILVDRYLRHPQLDTVFLGGDTAAAECSEGRTTVMSCQHAMTMGRFAGENAARDLLGLDLLPYRQPRYVTCLDLGRSGALFTEGWDRRPALTGAAAKRMKHRINRSLIYPPAGSADAILAASEL